MPFAIADDETPSSLYAGLASKVYKQIFVEPFKDKILQAKEFASKIYGSIKDAVAQVKKGVKFFVDWFKDDPIPAGAAAIAVGASLGLIVVLGGAAAGSIGGGMAALRAMSLAGKIKAGLKIVAAFFSVGGLIRFMIRGIQYAWNFNWNITASAIKAQQDSLILNLYSLTGSVLGSSMATLLCGIAPIAISQRTGLIKVNPMTLAMINELTVFNPHSDDYGEIYEEMMQATKALINAGVRATAQIMFLESYKNIRKWIKDTAQHTKLASIFPKLADTIAKWGNEGSQSWSFASATENWVESIPDKKIQALTEETIESFMDTCTENALVISYLY